MPSIIPISAVVATRDRPDSLERTLASLNAQDLLPQELIVIEGSTNERSRQVVAQSVSNWPPSAVQVWQPAALAGAAPQRNQGAAVASQPFIWFFDDDVRFEPDCVARLWQTINSDPKLGGVNAMILNQQYHPPGWISRTMFTLMHGRREQSFAGKVIGPAVNLLPEDRDGLPEIVPVDWLNTTCTLYRREALPSPVFDSWFAGYSLMEDVALSLRVGKNWKLANARTARIFHDSQPGEHKSDPRTLARMEVTNRRYVMRNVQEQRGALPLVRLLLWHLFQIASVAASRATRRKMVPILLGQLDGIKAIILRRKQ